MIPTKDDLIYEVCSTLGRTEDDAVLSLVDKLLLMFERQQNNGKQNVSGSLPLDDLLHFAEYCGEHFLKMHGGWMPRYADQRIIDNLLTTEQLYARWRQ